VLGGLFSFFLFKTSCGLDGMAYASIQNSATLVASVPFHGMLNPCVWKPKMTHYLTSALVRSTPC
jgi:hypothetical protein